MILLAIFVGASLVVSLAIGRAIYVADRQQRHYAQQRSYCRTFWVDPQMQAMAEAVDAIFGETR